MAFRVTFRQLNEGFGALARLAGVTSEDPQANYRLGKTYRQATAAMKDFDTEMGRLRDLFPQEEFIGPKGEKLKRVAEAHTKKFQPLADRLLDTEIKLWGTALSVDDASKLFKPSPAEIAVLLGWLIAEKEEDADGYERPQFAEVDLASLGGGHLNGGLTPALVVPAAEVD